MLVCVGYVCCLQQYSCLLCASSRVDFDGEFDTPNGSFSFKLIKVSEESIIIRTDEPIRLDTLTMDAGAGYTIEYK